MFDDFDTMIQSDEVFAREYSSWASSLPTEYAFEDEQDFYEPGDYPPVDCGDDYFYRNVLNLY